MRLCIALLGALTCFAVGAQPTTDQRLDRFERRLNEIEQKYQTEIKSRDEEITRLREEVNQLRRTPPTTDSTDEIERTKQDILKDIETNRTPQTILRTPVSFNPDIAIITNYLASISGDNANPARNRFDVGELELDIRAAVDPRADGVAIISLERDVDDDIFFNKSEPGDEEPESVETGIALEEGYLFLHDFGVPNLTAKLGRFNLRFGRQNILHRHDLPTSDNPYVNRAFLHPEALSDSGLSLSYVIPPNLTRDHYVELIAEIISGEGDEEAPVFNNDQFVDSPALNTHVLWNHDVAKDWNLELGASWLTGKHNNDNRQNANLFGVDVTLIHTDPTGRFNNLLLQGEAIYGDVDTSRETSEHAWGMYVLAQQQVNRDWYLGCRFDYTENALSDAQQVWAVSPYASWYWSEFLRFRLEYQHRDGDVTPEDTLFFQATWVFGAHPPHPYWSMR
jgi:hypothetical protein